MIFLTGDTHIPIDISKLNTKNFPEQKSLTSDDYVIILGDFGLYWNDDETYQYWREWLQNKPFTILWIDGNHENFDWINAMPVSTWHGGKAHRDGNIIHLIRGQVFDIDSKKFFVMGGADSYDRAYRTPHVSWWPQERPSTTDIRQAEKTLSAVESKVDYVLTHTCPLEMLDVIKYHHPDYDLSGRHDIEELLQYIREQISFEQWFFGHWHEDFSFHQYRCLYNNVYRLC